MKEHDLRPDGELTPEQAQLVQDLTEADIHEIDQALLSYATTSWRKAAFVVGSAMMSTHCSVEGIPDVFYAMRLKGLVSQGVLEALGSLDYMRYSEVRLAHERDAEPH